MGLVDDKVVLVTGGASGIGRAAVEGFVAEGASAVVVADLDAEGAAAVAAELGGGGAVVEGVGLDVTDEAAVAAAVDGVVERHGRLDCAFNNAGISDSMVAFHELDLERWNRMLATNLTSVFLCMKHELRHMSAAGRGAIVNTSSGAGLVAAPGQPHYTAAKHGVLGVTRAAAQEYARAGIRVNAVLPGSTETPMLSGFIGGDAGIRKMIESTVITGSLLDPAEIAEVAVWLASDHASKVNAQSIVVDGGGICH